MVFMCVIPNKVKNMEDKKTILLVEDDVFVTDIYNKKLNQEGYEVRVSANGLEAIKILEETTPDLVLLDIMMPYMDGREVLKKMKENKVWSEIPVILLTNLSEKEEIIKGMKEGADQYLIKSHFTPSEVVEKIKSVLGEK